MDIALKIKELIEEKKISITDFSEKLNVSRNTVYNFLNKKHPIDVELLQKISQILDVPIITFFGIEDPKLNEELLKTIEKQNEFIRLLKQKSYIIESIASTMKTYYWTRYNTIDKSLKDVIISNKQYQEIDTMFMASLNAILYFENDPDSLTEYQEIIRGLRDRVSQPSNLDSLKNGLNSETPK